MRRPKTPPAPGAEHDVRLPRHDVSAVGNDAVLAHGLARQLRETVVTTGDADQLRHPGNGADVRVVPLFKIHARTALERSGCSGHVCQAMLHRLDALHTLLGLPDHGSELVEHRKNLSHAALVKDGDLHAGPDQLRRNVSLQVRKADHAVRLERHNFVDLGTQKSTDPGLVQPRLRRAHRVARNPHNAPLFPQQIKPLGGLFCQADDALGAEVHGLKRALCG